MNNSNLERYLKSEIEKLKTDIENKKNRHYVNQTLIEEHQRKINEYRDKEDSVFNLLSPISVESSYKAKIADEQKIIEEINNENLSIVTEIDECKKKIQEIEKQLSAQRENAELSPNYDNYGNDSSSNETVTDEETESDLIEDWMGFIDKILMSLEEAESCCYSNPKLCKDKISQLREFINTMCYGNE